MVDEEGPRFGAAIFGSRALCGELDVDEILARTDPEGNVLRDLAALRGVTAADAARRARVPGPRGLLDRGARRAGTAASSTCPLPLGVATSLAARERWRCTLRGVSDHAGTAAMAGRRDALVPAARAVLAAHELALAEPGAVATVGRISALPGSTNQVPGEAHLSLDVRAPGQPALERVREGVRAAARAEGVEPEWLCESADPGCVFDAGLRAALHDAARAEGLAAIDLAAYAGHDAGVLARHLPAAMLFVRNPTGISHNPAESASEEDCLAACAVLARALVRERYLSVRPPWAARRDGDRRVALAQVRPLEGRERAAAGSRRRQRPERPRLAASSISATAASPASRWGCGRRRNASTQAVREAASTCAVQPKASARSSARSRSSSSATAS